MTDTALVKYEKPLHAPVQTTDGARALILANKADLAIHIANASGIGIEELASSAISAIVTAEPKAQAALLACSGKSILKAVADSARYGLIIGTVMGQAYLVPFGKTCQLIVGYRGLEAMAYRSGKVRAIQSATVYKGDVYDVQIGRQPDPIRHKPDTNADHGPENIAAAYAVAWMDERLALAESMNREDLDHIRSKSKMGRAGAYVTDLGEMMRKAAVRRLCKHLPLSPSDRRMMDEALSAEDALDGTRVVAAEVVDEGEKRGDELLNSLGKPEPKAPADPDDFGPLARGADDTESGADG